MRQVPVQVQNDLFDVLSRTRKPILAVAEMIWNGLDASATEVNVELVHGKMGGLEMIRVEDNGDGIPDSEVEVAFGNLGGSTKKLMQTNRAGRIFHGRLGKGRYRVFSLGSEVTWTTRFAEDGKVYEYQIQGRAPELKVFEVTDREVSAKPGPGTVVEVRKLKKKFPSLIGSQAVQELTEHLALYMMAYQNVAVRYDTAAISPLTVITSQETFPLRVTISESRENVRAELTVIEWRHPAERVLYLCDAEGFALHEVAPGIHAPGLNFTGYLRCGYFRQLEDEGSLDLDIHPGRAEVLDAARCKLREYYRTRRTDLAGALVDKWKKERVYPYEGQPADIIERQERQVFDLVAVSVSDSVMGFEESEPANKRLSFRLLRQALETSPRAVRRIMQEVLDLPQEKQEELADLLRKTSLAAIISASREIVERLDFLKGLDQLLFGTESKEQLRERRQLHRILAENAWLFGEQYHISADDEDLTRVLKAHLKLLKDRHEVLEPVTCADESRGIIDLMLSRAMEPRPGEREHLIVELKRPAVKVDDRAVTQIEKYAQAIAEDERFKNTNTRWVFWVISNDMTSSVQRRARQRGRPRGIVDEYEELQLVIWVKTWGEVIEDAKSRLNFFQERLKYAASHESGIELLRRTYEKYLPPSLRASVVSHELQ